jgi:phage virion morphogenesis protein
MPTDPIADHLQGLLSAIGPAERTRLARAIAADLRQRQRQRIAGQLNPDGTPYAPRKPRLSTGRGRIRRAMFQRLRSRLVAQSTADEAVVAITGRAARIARVHQYGLTDRVAPGGPDYRYPARGLLGLTDADRAAIADRIVDHLAGAL